jgi:hypothetical protein
MTQRSSSHTRLLPILNSANVSEQFTTLGCQEAIHTLHAALSLHILHIKETFILFVYLVNAYTTLNHFLLFQILERYDIPTELVDVIRRIYDSCEIETSSGKGNRFIDYLTGVQQGDDLAPILFLFLMLAVSQTLKKWKFKTLKYGYVKETKWGKSGKLQNQNYKTQGTYLFLFHLFYVEDITFFFESLDELTHGSHVILDHYTQFSLIVHTGYEGNK